MYALHTIHATFRNTQRPVRNLPAISMSARKGPRPQFLQPLQAKGLQTLHPRPSTPASRGTGALLCLCAYLCLCACLCLCASLCARCVSVSVSVCTVYGKVSVSSLSRALSQIHTHTLVNASFKMSSTHTVPTTLILLPLHLLIHSISTIRHSISSSSQCRYS
jgi:hypothetical protein